MQLLQPDIRSEDVSKTSLTKPHSLNKPNMLDSDGHGHWMNKSNVGMSLTTDQSTDLLTTV